MQAPAPRPGTFLGYHRTLSPTAGARVSPLCLGTMNFGTKWSHGLGECSQTTAFSILDRFRAAGGNWLDTANHYQNGQSEEWVGQWMKQRQCRDEMFLATKFTSGFDPVGADIGDENVVKANFQGNHTKSLKLSVETSLRQLRTDYVDLLYVHWWDFTTSEEEVMRSLHRLVMAGKVLYLGVSDTPAWVVCRCNAYSRQHGLTPFSVYQGHYSAAMRDLERDVLPMCEKEGMAIATWGSLGRGFFKSASEHSAPDKDGRNFGRQPEKQRLIAEKLQDIANRKNTAVTSVALAYVMQKTPYIFPIIGGRKLEHLDSNIEALGIDLSQEDIIEIDDAVDFDIGFPMNFLFEYGRQGKKYRTWMTSSDIPMVTVNTRLDTVPKALPIQPRQGERHDELADQH